MITPRYSFQKISLLLVVLVLAAGCSSKIQPLRSSEAVVGYKSQVADALKALPAPDEKIVVGVYKFRDQTGQYKPGGSVVSYSTAVTQGATSMLIKALEDVGGGNWFTILERESLPNLLNERKIIRQTRKQYLNQDQKQVMPRLPPLLYAPIMMDGGVVAYESNLLTGGAGARYFGAGGNTQFQRDSVTIYLRAVSVKNGQIVKSVLTNKTIFSLEVDAGLFRFVSFKRLLEVETGFTTNEPPQMAVLEAIEKAVYSMVIEGVMDGLWSFEDPKQGKPFIENYLEEKDPDMVAKFDDDGNYIGGNYAQKVSTGNPVVRDVKKNENNKFSSPPAKVQSNGFSKKSSNSFSNGNGNKFSKDLSEKAAPDKNVALEPQDAIADTTAPVSRPQDFRRQGFN